MDNGCFSFNSVTFAHLIDFMLLNRNRVVTAVMCCMLSAVTQAQTQPANTTPSEQTQTAKLSGKLVDKDGKAVPYATVTLLRGDKPAGGALTDDNGAFSIDFSGGGNFILRISGIGIDNKDVPVQLAGGSDKQLGIIKATSSAQQLKTVEVTGERNVIEMTAEKKTFNVEKNITTAGGSAADVLQNVPSVSVDADGNVSLRGKSGATILIDGKPATLLGGDAASALQSLPASTIQSVEVITNPSAKYDAQGMSGIINIITKKDKKFGLNGSASMGTGTRDKYNGGLNLNLKNKKWNIFLNSNFKLNRNYQRTTTDRKNFTNPGSYYTYEDNIRKFNGWFNAIGAEYTINDRNTITLTENLNFMQWGGDGVSTYSIYDNPEHVESVQRRSNYSLGGPVSSSTSLDYKHKFVKPKRELTANVTYATTHVNRKQQYQTTNYNGAGELSGNPIYQNAPGGGGNNSLNAQLDYTTPFLTKNGKLDAGLKTQLFWFNSKNDPIIDSGTGAYRDYVLYNEYEYTQQTHAAYMSFSDQFGKFNYSIGLRGEYAYYEGKVATLGNKTYSNEFINPFPSVFASYKLKPDQSIYASYTRRTNRPFFMQLMPYVDVSNPQDTSAGNPNLKPEFINNTELSYNKQFKKGHNLMASAYYQYTRNMIERYRVFYANGTTFTQPQNLTSGQTYGVELTGKLQLLPIWDATVNFNFFQNEILGTNIDPTLNNSGFSWFGKANTNVKLPLGFSLQLSGNYEAPKVAAQGKLHEVYWIDAALRKNLMNNKATVVINVSDIFNTKKYTTIYDYPAYTQSVYRARETRIGNITFTYRFGKSEFKQQGQGRKRNQQSNTQIPDKDRQNLKSDDNGEQNGF